MIAINSTDFDVNNLQSTFHVDIEEMDIRDGALLDEVEVFIQFKDKTPDNGSNAFENTLLQTLQASEWVTGFNGLPTSSLVYTYQELLTTTGLTANQVAVTDQFLVLPNLKLTDRRFFNASNASSIILEFNTFFNSPLCESISIIEPIAEDLFTGMYLMESIVDGPNGQTFVDVNGQRFSNGCLVEVVKGHSLNTREVRGTSQFTPHWYRRMKRWVFTVVDTQILMGKNQLSPPEDYLLYS